jgi:uncharacterized protein (DUF1330 family)
MTCQVIVGLPSTGHHRAETTPHRKDTSMTAYGIAHLHNPNLHPEVIDYIDRIQATLDPFGGRFVVHGAQVEVVEGNWPGTVVIVEFPDVDRARAWYRSPAYQEILHLRTDHIDGDVILVEGVGPDYDPSATAARLRGLADAG